MHLRQDDLERLGRLTAQVLDLPCDATARPYDAQMWRVDFGAGGYVGSSVVLDDQPPADTVWWMLESPTNDRSEVEEYRGRRVPPVPGASASGGPLGRGVRPRARLLRSCAMRCSG